VSERPLVIGLGNEMRGDDAAGLMVADLVSERGVDAVRCAAEPIDLLELIPGRERVLVVDAVAGGQPGRIWRLDADEGELPALFAERSSTHLIGLAEVIELARPLGRLPERLEVIGIEGDCFGLGSRPSPAVASAVRDVAATILVELREGAGAPRGERAPAGRET
jgi:hydrogenase maturation protease